LIAFVIPAFLFASAAKFARASIFEVPPILCDGVADDTSPLQFCALPEQTTKDQSSTKAKALFVGKACCPAIFHPHIAPAGTRPLISSTETGLRFKRPLSHRAGSSGDPDGPH
jgi:hypothetical protein